MHNEHIVPIQYGHPHIVTIQYRHHHIGSILFILFILLQVVTKFFRSITWCRVPLDTADTAFDECLTLLNECCVSAFNHNGGFKQGHHPVPICRHALHDYCRLARGAFATASTPRPTTPAQCLNNASNLLQPRRGSLWHTRTATQPSPTPHCATLMRATRPSAYHH